MLITLAASAPVWSAYGTCAAAVVTAVAVVLAGVTIASARREARRTRAYAYMERHYRQDFATLVSEARRFWRLRPDRVTDAASMKAAEAARLVQWKNMPRLKKSEILLVFNFCEEIAGMFNSGLLDEEITKKMLAPAIITYWNEAGWLIESLRGERSAKVFGEWAHMYDRLAGESRFDYLVEQTSGSGVRSETTEEQERVVKRQPRWRNAAFPALVAAVVAVVVSLAYRLLFT
jgi:hypothetical protein